MTILFHPNLKYLMIGRGILASGITGDSGITVFSGAQPDAADILANWALYNSNNPKFLAHYSSVNWSHPVNGSVPFCSITKFPVPVPAMNTGMGTWCIVWTTNPTGAQLSSATIPTNSFIVGTVTDLVGQGIVRFATNTDFIIGVNKVIADGVISSAIS